MFSFHISIHALRKESDQSGMSDYIAEIIFQSTLSVRRATGGLREDHGHALISIHALRKESDPLSRSFSKSVADFNPRSP